MDEREVRKIIREQMRGDVITLSIAIALTMLGIAIVVVGQNRWHQELKARIEQLETNPGTSR